MHEFHVVDGIVKEVLSKAKSADAKKVTEVVLVMGTACGFEESSVRLYFEEIGRGTILDGAKLVIKALPSQLRCNTCNKAFDYKTGEFDCPTCGNPGTRPSGGKEFYIDHIEIDS